MLLDSHALLWWLEANPKLSRRALDAIRHAPDRPYFSAVSIFELEWKIAREKIGPFLGPIRSLAIKEGFLELKVSAEHAHAAAHLPGEHRDPWDRLIAGQAILSGWPVVTCDAEIQKLGVQTIW